jgi:uncharacterized protein
LCIFAVLSQKMTQTSQILNYLTLNKNRFRQEYHIVRIGVFGSFARNEQHDGSDIDLVVEFEENTENLQQIKESLKSEIQARFNLQVDICREKYIKPIFKNQIQSQTIYA